MTPKEYRANIKLRGASGRSEEREPARIYKFIEKQNKGGKGHRDEVRTET
jgi:hypothetical protein